MTQIEQFKREIDQNKNALYGCLNAQHLLLERLKNNTIALSAIGNRLKALDVIFQCVDRLQWETQDMGFDLILAETTTFGENSEPIEKPGIAKPDNIIRYPLLFAIRQKRLGGWGRRRH